jgi:SAM-dependent methyltransferase
VDDLHRFVERGYDAIAERYDLAARANRGPETYFRSFLDGVLGRIPPHGRVLDLGCGAGSITCELARRGRVIGLDRSSVQLALARANAPEAMLVRADIAELPFAARSFDVVTEFWSLIHVRRDRHAEVLAGIGRCLRPGGLLAGTFGSRDDPEDRSDFFGAPMAWSHFDAETTRRMLQDAGFALEQAEVIEDEGEQALWVIATVGPLPPASSGRR